MGTRTLYVAGEDEGVWEEAQKLAGDAAESLSRLATEGLRNVLAERREAEDDERATDHAAAVEDAAAIGRFSRELRRLGWERAGRAFTRACIDYGAARSRAKRKADETKGVVGRQADARKAQETKGVEGRKAAARKAWHTRKARSK